MTDDKTQWFTQRAIVYDLRRIQRMAASGVPIETLKIEMLKLSFSDEEIAKVIRDARGCTRVMN